ncbi:MAG: diguanylate cyclase [Kiritimatiellae bacterium]|nr:diguanylate cyclase [Kiritimatiellia bacterium]
MEDRITLDASDRFLLIGFSPDELILLRRALHSFPHSSVLLTSIKASIQQIFYDDYVAAFIKDPSLDKSEIFLIEEAKHLAPWRGILLFGETNNAPESRLKRLADATVKLSDNMDVEGALAAVLRRRRQWTLSLSSAHLIRFHKLFHHMRASSLNALKEQDAMRSRDLVLSTIIKHTDLHFIGLLDLNETVPFFILEHSTDLLPEEAARLADRIAEHIRMVAPPTPDSTIPQPIFHPHRHLTRCNPETVRYSLLPIIMENHQTAWLFLSISRSDYPMQLYYFFLVHVVHYMASIFTALQRLRNLAFKDSLTGLYNRRYMEEAGGRMFLLGQRYGHNVAILFIDVDRFKHINDQLGHNVGDQALMMVADILTKSLRQSDIIARYGGDEFLVLLPHTSSIEAENTANRICRDARGQLVDEKSEAIPLSLSIGIALSSADKRDFSETIHHADEALLKAKSAGGNQAVQWSGMDMGEDASRTPAISAPAPATAPFTTEQMNQPGILLVDDDPIVLQYIERLLQKRPLRTFVALSSAEAVRLIEANPDAIDLLITDINLPDMNGFELLQAVKEKNPSIATIVISSDLSTERAILSVRHGAYDIIQKPFTGDQLFISIDRALEYHRVIMENRSFQQQLIDIVNVKSSENRRSLEQLKEAYQCTLDTMVAMLDAREQYTSQHSVRVRDLTVYLARKMGFKPSAVKEIAQGALLHDIGKIGIADSILLKPSALTAEERRVMEQHPCIGHSFLQSNDALKYAAELVLSHHERWDGSGYPRRLREEEILIGARIFSVIDCYDAIRSRRVYKPPIPPDEALRIIREGGGKLYDPSVVEIFTEEHAAIESMGQWDAANA